MTEFNLSLLEKTIHQNIPLSRMMAVQVVEGDSTKLVLSAPFEINSNDKDTAFGGSIAALATLAGWAFLYLQLTPLFKTRLEIVIQKSKIDFLKPITQNFFAHAYRPDEATFELFLRGLTRKKMAGIEIPVDIFQAQEHQPAVRYLGKYVAYIPQP